MAFARIGEARGIAVGRHVLMPDHAHLFVQGNLDFVLTQWVRLLKRDLSSVISIRRPHWQKGFFDHVIRNSESYTGNGNTCVRTPCAQGSWPTPKHGPGKASWSDWRRCRGACVKRLLFWLSAHRGERFYI
jgi:hypothetical protein